MKGILVCLSLLLLAVPATAAGKLYVGAGAGKSSAELEGGSSQIDFDDTGYIGYVGYRVMRNFSAELSYADFGSPEATVGTTSLDAKLKIAALWAVGVLTLTPNVELYGRLGYGAWDSSVEVRDGVNPPSTTDADGTDLAWGAGLGYNLTPRWGIELDWHNYEVENADGVDFTALTVRYRF